MPWLGEKTFPGPRGTFELGSVSLVGLTEATSNVMGQLAGIGLVDLAHGNDDGSIAAQGAIWELEYGGPVTSPNAAITEDIFTLLDTVHNNGTGFAHGLISLDGTQDQILASPAVPEASTWAMMLIGFLGLGFAARQTKTRRVAL